MLSRRFSPPYYQSGIYDICFTQRAHSKTSKVAGMQKMSNLLMNFLMLKILPTFYINGEQSSYPHKLKSRPRIGTPPCIVQHIHFGLLRNLLYRMDAR